MKVKNQLNERVSLPVHGQP